MDERIHLSWRKASNVNVCGSASESRGLREQAAFEQFCLRNARTRPSCIASPSARCIGIRCSWYSNETRKPNDVTRKQRACFAVQGGLADDYVRDTLGLDTSRIHRNLVQAIDGLNRFTHIEEAVFGLGEVEVKAQVLQAEVAVAELFTTIQECRQEIISALAERIDDAVVDETLREMIMAIDEIAAHHSIDEVYTHRVEIMEITHDEIRLKATGTIGTELRGG